MIYIFRVGSQRLELLARIVKQEPKKINASRMSEDKNLLVHGISKVKHGNMVDRKNQIIPLCMMETQQVKTPLLSYPECWFDKRWRLTDKTRGSDEERVSLGKLCCWCTMSQVEVRVGGGSIVFFVIVTFSQRCALGNLGGILGGKQWSLAHLYKGRRGRERVEIVPDKKESTRSNS